MDHVQLSRQVEERYRRYLATTFYFKDPALRMSFEDALNSGHLVKGPYLEGTPVFKRGQTPRILFQNLLKSQPEKKFLNAVNPDRSLYQHQEEAIQKVFNEHNVIVATGTGSGKTESFLYPILLHLYQECQAGQLCHGVRALILYPMNALANDQRDRLGEISSKLKEARSPFQFTFGQYIGETPEDESDSRRHARDHIMNRLSGELVLRSQMRNTPPHILLTNYSMLEYLLLRPDDSPLFDKGRAQWWKFLVLDEAHQYRGSKGIEMAMLLRRLKRRLREGGRTKPFRCIATSATLMGEPGDKATVAQFGSDLFGEEFLENDVILGEAEPIPELCPKSLDYDDYRFLKEALDGKSTEARIRLINLATKLGVPLPGNEDLPKGIGRLLQHDLRTTQLRRCITSNPMEFSNIANGIFGDLPDEKRVIALAELVELLVQTSDPSSDAPLLSARYHLFLRSLEGAFVSHWPQKKVFLDRKSVGEAGTAFEIALCRECGQHYFVAKIQSGKIVEANRDPSHVDFGAFFFRPIEKIRENVEDEEDEAIDTNNKREFQLCTRCGAIARAKPDCGHEQIIRVIKEDSPDDEDKADQIKKCGACGYSAAGRDPVREVVHGTDGPHAVVATTLYQNLPENRKKILAFADGRQEAAFFAWYLEESYKDIQVRNTFRQIVQSFTTYPTEGISLRTLADKAFCDYYDAFKVRESDDEPMIRKSIWRAVYREFLTDEERISLEGVGLIRWSIKWPVWFKPPEVFGKPPWSLDEQEAQNLTLMLLDSMRTDRAVEIQTESGVTLNWSDLGLLATQTCFRVGRAARPRGFSNWPVKSWDGVGHWDNLMRTKRTMFLTQILMKSGIPEDAAIEQAVITLRKLWEDLQQREHSIRSREPLLQSVPKYDARRLNPNWWRLYPICNADQVVRCDTCGCLSSTSVRGVCPKISCHGSLHEVRVKDLELNHYRILYEAYLPSYLRVEEHTAQLAKEIAREFQHEFRTGKIHVLSCSTTFELGVDLGDLDTIFLRNVPPEAFNYAQRVGRAGRRRGFPGFAITYCRRNPHDLYHFAEPERMLRGKVHPPVLSLQNEKIITRHIAATALSRFFRMFPERFKTVSSFLGDMTNPLGVPDFNAFLNQKRGNLEGTLKVIVPLDMQTKVGLSDGRWIERIAGSTIKIAGSTKGEDESRLFLAEEEASSDYKKVIGLEEESRNRRDYGRAEWAQKRANTIAMEDVLSFLSRKAVIPKYGFPVDVVELDTQRTQQNQEASEVSLQRDLSIAISEFAPTSKLIANKKEWTSYGIKRVAGKEWERKYYKRCARHNVFFQWAKGEPEPPTPCDDRLAVFEYVIPRFGFLTDRDKPKNPTSRSLKVFTTRPYFAGSLGTDLGTVVWPLHSPLVSLKKSCPGRMLVLCEGRRGSGFYICDACGAGFRKREKIHSTPLGQECHGKLDNVSLGHEFVTDVLQLQFHLKPEDGIEPIWFAYSLAFALVEGAAEVLEVPSMDLSATVAHTEEYSVPPIVLYDNVPGGAGLVARLEIKRELDACLTAALKRVSGICGCDENTSCYGCLRNYRNQFAHQYLQRGPVFHYIERLLSKWHQ